MECASLGSLWRPASELLFDGAGFFGDHIAGVSGGFPFEQQNVTLLLCEMPATRQAASGTEVYRFEAPGK